MIRNRTWPITLLMVTGLVIVAATGTAYAQDVQISRSTFGNAGGVVSTGSLSVQVDVGNSGSGIVQKDSNSPIVCTGFLCRSSSSSSSMPSLGISAIDADKSEGNSGPTPFTFTVKRGGDTSDPATVKATVSGSGGDPANAQDFTGGAFPSETVTFNPGETSKTVTVNVNGDTDVEQDEGFTVTLSDATGAQINTGSTAGTIRNDDSSSGLPISGVEINEVYYLGSASEDWVELKNVTNGTIIISEWWLCSEITYGKLGDMTVISGNLNLPPGGLVVVRAWRDLGNAAADLGLYHTGGAFGDPDNMVDFLQWGTSSKIGRSSEAVLAGLWTEISPGVYDFVPTASTVQAAAVQSTSWKGTQSGGGQRTQSSDFFNGPDSQGKENSPPSSSSKDIYLPQLGKNK